MTAFSRTLQFLGDAPLGIFGAGHLGSTIAECLLRSGFPADRLLICHGHSSQTAEHLANVGLGANVVEPPTLAQSSTIILYVVRPQSVDAIAGHKVRGGAMIISFLAGVRLARLPVEVSLRVRVIPSPPATIAAQTAIAGVFPGGNEVVEELLRELGIRQLSLDKEDDVHAFTAFGPCLPIVLSSFRARGGVVNDSEIAASAGLHGLKAYQPILQWANSVEPRFETEVAHAEYLRKAATPGGVTEAMLEVVESGRGLIEALERGVSRSRELSVT